MKIIFVVLILLTPSLKMTAQDTVKVFINNKQVAETVAFPDQPGNLLQVKKSNQPVSGSFIIQVTGVSIDNLAFKHTLELLADDSRLIEETENKRGHFTITNTSIKQQLFAGKTFALYLLLNPSSASIDIPSRRIFLGNLVMK